MGTPERDDRGHHAPIPVAGRARQSRVARCGNRRRRRQLTRRLFSSVCSLLRIRTSRRRPEDWLMLYGPLNRGCRTVLPGNHYLPVKCWSNRDQQVRRRRPDRPDLELDECTIAAPQATAHYSQRGEGNAQATLDPFIGSGEAADIGASRRPNHSNRPFLARTPARPDWAKPGSEAARCEAGGFR